MSYENILYQTDGAIARITINRPDKLNALNHQTIGELAEVFDEVADDDTIRVAIIDGAGGKAFVAGADISEITALSPMMALEFSRAGQALMLQIETLGKPVIAVIDGYALGGGCELAMACTLRVASHRARLGQPEIALGIIPGFGGTQRLLRLAGRSAAMELCLLGNQIDGKRAHDLGLVQRVVDHDELDAEVERIAEQLSTSAPLAVRSIIEAINLGSESSLERGLEYETQLFALCCSTEDMREGTQAFLEKRRGEFKGR